MRAFVRMLLPGGRLPDGSRLLTRSSIDAMTTDQIDVASGAPGPLQDGSQGRVSASVCRDYLAGEVAAVPNRGGQVPAPCC